MDPASPPGNRKPSATGALAVALLYAAGAGLWIGFSDSLLGYFLADPRTIVIASVLKGWLFVAVTALLLFALLQRQAASRASLRVDAVPPVDKSDHALLWSLAAVILAVVLAGAMAIDNLIERHKDQGFTQLRAIADLKADQIERWFNDRRRDAEQLRTAIPLHTALRRWQASGDAASRQLVLDRLESMRDIKGYQSIFAVDATGRTLFGAGAPRPAAAALRQALDTALASGTVQFTDAYRVTEDQEQINLDFVVPLPAVAGRAGLALVMRLDEAQFLFPFLQKWPLPSHSAETQLLRRDGDGVLFLNEMRHRSGTALKLRVPFSAASVLGVQIASGRVQPDTPLTGIDYRGVAVMGIARSVPGTSWYLVTKMDRDEMLAETKRDLFWLALALFAALCTTLAGGLLLRQRRELRWAAAHRREQDEKLRLQLEIGREREERMALASHYATLIEKAHDIILLIDPDGRIVEANRAAEAAYGRSADELRGRHVRDLRAPEALADIEQHWQAAASPQGVLFETVHRRRDGSSFPVEVSSSSIEIEGRHYRQSFIRDISERKEAAAALSKSSRLLLAVMDQTFQSIGVLDTGGTLVDVNRTALNLVGADKAAVLGRPFWETPWWSHSASLQQQLRDAVGCAATGETVRFEATHPAADGSLRQVDFSLKPVFDAAGKVASLVAEGRDITERKLTEQILATHKQVLEMVASGAPLADTLDTLARAIEARAEGMLVSILLLDADGVHVRHAAGPSLPPAFVQAIDGQPIGPNAGSCGTAAYRREPVIVADIATDPLWADYRALALANDLRACWSTPIIGADGRVLGTFALYYNEPRLPTDHHRRLIALATDSAAIAIARQREEAALRDSETRYRQVVDNVKEVIFQTDVAGSWVFLNPAWTEITGFGVEASLGRPFLDFVHPDDRQHNLELFEPLIQREKDTCHHEIRYLHKDGGFRWIEVYAHLMLDENDAILGTAGTLADVTERKKAAEALQQQAGELRSRNEELERFNRATVGRELDMIELKRQVNALARELGRAAPFPLAFDDAAGGGERPQ